MFFAGDKVQTRKAQNHNKIIPTVTIMVFNVFEQHARDLIGTNIIDYYVISAITINKKTNISA